MRLGLDEYEALRLADLERLQHEDAALQMGVSRQTFGRILDAGHVTVARALVEGRPLHIEGGPVCPPPRAGWRCPRRADPDAVDRGNCPRRLGCALRDRRAAAGESDPD